MHLKISFKLLSSSSSHYSNSLRQTLWQDYRISLLVWNQSFGWSSKIFKNPFSGDNLELIAIFTIISVISIVLGSLKFYSLNKEETMTAKGKALISAFVLLSLIARILSIIYYFAPSMGLLNLLGHWKRGNLEMNQTACGYNKVVNCFTYPQISCSILVLTISTLYQIAHHAGILEMQILFFLILFSSFQNLTTMTNSQNFSWMVTTVSFLLESVSITSLYSQ